MKVIYSDKCLEYEGRPESPSRVKKTYEFLKDKGYKFSEPKPAAKDDIELVHSPNYIEKIKTGDLHDPDTPSWENIYEYAKLSVGGALKAQEEKGVSLLRPPGHHAGRNGRALGALTLGFCYFNSIAIAISKSSKDTLIVDVDSHHGNGTQEIFQGSDSVVYLSLHRHPHYPGTGKSSKENCINYPLRSDVGDEKYLEALEEGVDKALEMQSYEQVAVSAGFDGYKGDLASLSLSSKCFWEIGKRIGELEKPTFSVLEGGYGDISGRVYNFINGLESA